MTLPFDAFTPRRSHCVVFDLGEHCELRESLLGYIRHLGERRVRRITHSSLGRTECLIIPGAAHISASTAQSILACIEGGGTVLLESGALFGDCGEHRLQLREYFDIRVKAPVELWPARGIPYIEYRWPISARVRDFSRVMPLAPQRGTVIAKVNDMPVALARRVGSGTLVFLGSPMGPALWASDPEAQRWLGAVLPLGDDR
ncbi:MAG TPA: hypothetical protein VJN70_08255 [Gemmatimonadaceae bacterium]|nr:hypothetical protein [Gemmatimonadaceae bacterium]